MRRRQSRKSTGRREEQDHARARSESQRPEPAPNLVSLAARQVHALARPVAKRQDRRRAASTAVLLRRNEDRPLPERRVEASIWTRCAQSWRELKKALPPQYPFLQTHQGRGKPRDCSVCDLAAIANNPRRSGAARIFSSILCRGRAEAFHARQRPAGTGRGHRRPDESADRARDGESHLAASFRPRHRATRRAISASMGERPTHPELLDYLACALRGERLVDRRRCIARSCCRRRMRLSAEILGGELRRGSGQPAAVARQPAAPGRGVAARFAAVRRRQAGSEGGRPAGAARRARTSARTVYGFVSRRKLDPMLALFDFPNPEQHQRAAHGDQRPAAAAVLPEQRVRGRSRPTALAERLDGTGRRERIRQAYRLLFGREPRRGGTRSSGSSFCERKSGWPSTRRCC